MQLRYGCKHNCEVKARLKKGKIFTERCKHLTSSLAVPNVSHCVHFSDKQNVLNESRLVVLGHLLKTVVPKLHVDVRIQISVLSTESITPRIIHPHVEPCICKKECH